VTRPDAAQLMAVLEATWPARATQTHEGWLLRDGAGGGKRVSAAVALSPDADIAVAEAAMLERGQTPLFQITREHIALDAALTGKGYRLLDPTVIYVAPCTNLARKPPRVSLFDIWPPLAIMRDLWAEGGIGPARIDVMTRAAQPHTGFVARIDDRAAGVAFAALHDRMAMVHAIEVAAHARRKGLGALILRGVAYWAQAQGAEWLALAVTEANTGARALYENLGFERAAQYHYREQGVAP
jgi:N-acetylglutamate synthase